MPSLPTSFAALALQAGILEDESHFLFLQTGASGTLDLFIQTATGNVPVFTLNQKVILDGTGHPSGSPYYYTGTTYAGDYFIDRNLWKIYYNTGNAWNTGQSLIGPTGPQGNTGPTGATGPTGQGLITGGTINTILKKQSSTNYDAEWVNVFDIITDPKYYSFESYTQSFKGHLLDSGGSPAADIGSGVTYWQYRNSILVITDGSGATPAIIEYKLTGEYVRTIALDGFYDVESIDWHSGGNNGDDRFDRFVISEERTSALSSDSFIHLIEISPTTTVITSGGSGHLASLDLSASIIKNSPNEGIEALCVDPISGRIYFVLQTSVGSDWYLYYIDNYASSTVHAVINLYGITTLVEIRDMCFSRTENAIILAGYKTSLDNPAISKISLAAPYYTFLEEPMSVSSDIGQLEGICISEDGSTIILTGEDALYGADYIILNKNQLSNLYSSEGTLKYFGSNGINSVNSKIFEGVRSSVFTENDSSQSFTPSSFKGYVTLPSNFANEGNSIRLIANGKTTLSNTGGDCNLKLGLQNKINTTTVGGIDPSNSITFHYGDSYWNYDSTISFRESAYTCYSSIELYPETATGAYDKKFYLTSGVIPSSGDISLYISTISGGPASYNYNIELYQMQIYRN